MLGSSRRQATQLVLARCPYVHGNSRSSASAARTSAGGFGDFTLHSYWRSSCSWRVRIALAHHGIQYGTNPVHLLKGGGEQLQEAYKSGLNQLAQVPSLSFTDATGTVHTVTQSLAIISFLDAICSEGGSGASPLVPGPALARARALQMAEVINSGIQPLQNLATMKAIKAATLVGTDEDVDGRGFATAAIQRGLVACERLAIASPGRFAVSDEVTVADVCLVPQLYNARRFKVDLSAFPRLIAAEAACKALSSFEAATPDRQPDAEPE